MTDLELVRKCAEAMGYCFIASKSGDILKVRDIKITNGDQWIIYDPIHDDAQAMALVGQFRINIIWYEVNMPSAFTPTVYMWMRDPADLNRAIVETVAKLPD